MKKLLKTICLFLPVISLTACGSYGNEIDKVEANNIYKAAVDAYPDVYTNQLTSTTSSYQSNEISGGTPSKVVLKTTGLAEINKDELFYHIKVNVSLSATGFKSQSAHQEYWFYYKNSRVYKVTYDGKTMNHTNVVEDSKKGAETAINKMIASISNSNATEVLGNTSSLDHLADVASGLYSEVVNERLVEKKANVEREFDTKYYSKDEKNLTIVFKDKASYKINKSEIRYTFQSYKNFSYICSYRFKVEDNFPTEEETSVNFSAYSITDALQYQTKASVKVKHKKGCNIKYPNLNK